MVTGASTANLAIILVDATKGIITQTRRHTFLVSLLGIKHVVLAVNKMDLVDFDQKIFDPYQTQIGGNLVATLQGHKVARDQVFGGNCN